MNEKFSKLESLTEIKLNLVDIETAKTQLKSMKIGYIKLSFILKDLEKEFNRIYDDNLGEYNQEVLDKAEAHALKQIDNPNYYSGEVMKTVAKDVAQCFQAMLMLKGKKDELDGRRAEVEVVEKNIKWLRRLIKDLVKESSK